MINVSADSLGASWGKRQADVLRDVDEAEKDLIRVLQVWSSVSPVIPEWYVVELGHLQAEAEKAAVLHSEDVVETLMQREILRRERQGIVMDASGLVPSPYFLPPSEVASSLGFFLGLYERRVEMSGPRLEFERRMLCQCASIGSLWVSDASRSAAVMGAVSPRNRGAHLLRAVGRDQLFGLQRTLAVVAALEHDLRAHASHRFEEAMSHLSSSNDEPAVQWLRILVALRAQHGAARLQAAAAFHAWESAGMRPWSADASFRVDPVALTLMKSEVVHAAKESALAESAGPWRVQFARWLRRIAPGSNVGAPVLPNDSVLHESEILIFAHFMHCADAWFAIQRQMMNRPSAPSARLSGAPAHGAIHSLSCVSHSWNSSGRLSSAIWNVQWKTSLASSDA